MILFLARILLIATPVAYSAPPSWCATDIVDPGDDRRSGMVSLLFNKEAVDITLCQFHFHFLNQVSVS